MPRLHRLLQSCVTAVVRYQRTHSAESKDIPEEVIVQSLLDAAHAPMMTSLREMLRPLSHHSDYPLYQFLLHGISTLQTFLQKKEPPTAADLFCVQIPITQWITHAQTLLTTSHRSSLEITYLELGIPKMLRIPGLEHKGWLSNSLMPNGQMVCDMIFPILELSPTALPVTVVSTIKKELKEHQTEVLLRAQMKDIEALRQENTR